MWNLFGYILGIKEKENDSLLDDSPIFKDKQVHYSRMSHSEKVRHLAERIMLFYQNMDNSCHAEAVCGIIKELKGAGRLDKENLEFIIKQIQRIKSETRETKT